MSRIAKRTGLFLAAASISLGACALPPNAQTGAATPQGEVVSIQAALAHEFAVSAQAEETGPVSIRDALAHEFEAQDQGTGGSSAYVAR